MGTIAAMWSGSADPGIPIPGTFALCALHATDLRVRCMGIHHNGSNPPDTTQFLALSGGGHFACGVEYGSHFIVCWGELQVPQELQQVSYSIVASGGFHVCALRSDNSFVDCWGRIPAPPAGMAFASLVSGWGFSCGLTQAGTVACWGDLRKEILQPSNETFGSIFAGGNTACGVTLLGRLCCWGTADHGQSIPPTGLQFLSIAGGLYHTCGIRADNRQVLCWGDQDNGKLMAPLDVSFSQIAAGDFYTCGMRMDPPMDVVCWGNSVWYPRYQKNFTISRGMCVSECGRSQFQAADQLCPVVRDKVCLDCSVCVGNSEASPCGPLGDRKCDTRSQPRSTALVILLIAAALFLGSLLVLATWLYLLRREKSKEDDPKQQGDGKLEAVASKNENERSAGQALAMSALELEVATNSYSEEMVLGKGAFGTVYKGVLENGQAVAIKRASTSSTRSSELFEKELQLLTRTHHSCLVNLVGYCMEEKLLVFEFMSRGSLYDNIFARSGPSAGLQWICRIKLAAQAARGLEYLHKYACPPIIHRDVKSANILLDDEWNAHVSDFGLSLFGPLGSATHLSNMTIVGTPGYLDPEYGFFMKLTTKSDVYSFGVVLLELLSGQKPVDHFRPVQNIVIWAKELLNDDTLHQLFDPALAVPEMPEPLYRAAKLALECTDVRGKMRPSMTNVAKSLEDILESLKEQDTRPPSKLSESGRDSKLSEPLSGRDSGNMSSFPASI
ncbi:serine/threonine-protein kinase-like protein CR4 [Selaginella moellendorffii]|uniref:serine/threonine-protein kinase-like protein CR4 n=1 Tax=Selaginella moellendorffii TaxID=88036 RepID=UPI000D1C9E70|nr:serine/threonine-protein kinase-like protein CR4 [Selaginella moellendorffii]|eukprot:XP_024537245.1 serine/threonine-protein kinase-like protein CR4 [Selaginella moellendorffii]